MAWHWILGIIGVGLMLSAVACFALYVKTGKYYSFAVGAIVGAFVLGVALLLVAVST